MSRTRPWRLAAPLVLVGLAACTDRPTEPGAEPSAPSRGSIANLPPTAAAAPVGNARFAALNVVDVPVKPRAAGAMQAVAGSAPGTLVKSMTVANPDGCGVQTGIAMNGTHLIMSCWYNQKLDLYSPSTGALIKRLTVAGNGGINALAWDGQRNRLWACTSGYRVVEIDISDPDGDGNVIAAEVRPGFDTGGCYDGLAYDGADQTLWYSSDVESYVHHVQRDGTVIGGPYYIYDLLGQGNSGIAAGGGNLYLANNSNSQIYVTNKPPTSATLFATFPRRIEDLECDDITFRADGIATIWQQDAYDREIQAYAIEPGACPFGGFVVPQAVMDLQPGRISVNSSPVVNVILISNALFDASASNVANIRFVVNGNEAAGAQVQRRGANYVTSVADYNRDGLPDRMVVFSLAALRAAGLTAATTDMRVQDVTSAVNKFQATDTVRPTLVP